MNRFLLKWAPRVMVVLFGLTALMTCLPNQVKAVDKSKTTWKVQPPFPGQSVTITTNFGDTGGVYNGTPHTGIDIVPQSGGIKVYAIDAGTVTEALNTCVVGDHNCGQTYGNHVTINHGRHTVNGITDNMFTISGHLLTGSVQVKAGDKVKAGQYLGSMGNTGNSYGEHLHLTLSTKGPWGANSGGLYIDPRAIIDFPALNTVGKLSDGKTLASGGGSTGTSGGDSGDSDSGDGSGDGTGDGSGDGEGDGADDVWKNPLIKYIPRKNSVNKAGVSVNQESTGFLTSSLVVPITAAANWTEKWVIILASFILWTGFGLISAGVICYFVGVFSFNLKLAKGFEKVTGIETIRTKANDFKVLGTLLMSVVLIALLYSNAYLYMYRGIFGFLSTVFLGVVN